MEEDAITARIIACAIKLIYNGVRTKKGYRVDFFVENKVVVEVKAVKQIALIDYAQLKTYLNQLSCRVGLIINFNTLWLRTGIVRVLNRATPSA